MLEIKYLNGGKKMAEMYDTTVSTCLIVVMLGIKIYDKIHGN